MPYTHTKKATFMYAQVRQAKNTVMLSIILLIAFLGTSGLVSAHTAKAASPTTFYMQAMDSCKQAVPGFLFRLKGNGVDVTAPLTFGNKPRKVADGACLIQRGNCITQPTGCTSFSLVLPAGVYTVTLTPPAGSGLNPPQGYSECLGGSACSTPQTSTLNIDANGGISATTHNVYPNGASITWPTAGAPYTGISTDPITTHVSRLGTGNCDGDGDLDDHMTGSEGLPHCDNEAD